MSTSAVGSASAAISIVPASGAVAHLTFGSMALLFAGALCFGRVENPPSWWAIHVGAGLLLAGVVAAWIHTVRNPARLEITPTTITLAHAARAEPRPLRRESGVLYTFHAGARYGQTCLAQRGSEERMLIGLFNVREVRAAALAQGWSWEG